MKQLEELLRRVEAAEGPSAELDLAIRLTLLGDEIVEYGRGDIKMPFRQAYEHARQYDAMNMLNRMCGTAEPVTASLDAAIALVEKVLPGRASELVREAWSSVGEKHALHIRFWRPEADGSYAQALALALCAALLKAKIQSTGAATFSDHGNEGVKT